MPSIDATRRELLATVGATALAGCGALTGDGFGDRPRSFPGGDWPQVARDPTNTGRVAGGRVPADVTEAWAVPIDGWPWTSPVVGDGTVFQATERSVTAVTAATGERDWTADLPHEPGGTPAYGDGTLYVPGYGRRTRDEEVVVHAFDAASGEQRWSRRIGEGAVHAVTLADGIVYVRTEEAAVALEAGEQVWRHGGLDPLAYEEYNLYDSVDMTGNAAPAVTGRTAYVPVHGGVLALDRETGGRRWRADVGHALGVSAGERDLYVQGYTELRAFDRDGTPRWRRTDVGGTSAPTVADDAVYARDGDALHELDPETGEDRWTFDLRTTVLSSPSPVLENAVLAASHRAAVRRGDGPSLRSRGWWETSFDPAGFSAPAVGAGHCFLVDPYRERLVALEGA